MQWSKSAFHGLPSSIYLLRLVLSKKVQRYYVSIEITKQIFSWSFPTNFTSTITKMIQASDGLGPKKSSPGRAQALNVKLGPGPGLSPSLKAGPRAGPGRAGRACRAQSFT